MAAGWRKKVPPLVPLVSLVFGIVVLLFSFLHMLGGVGLQTKTSTDIMDLCKDAKGDKAEEYCGYFMEETAAGVIGCLFSIVQIGLSAWMFMKKNILRMWKVWFIASLVLFFLMLLTACLVFHAYNNLTCIKIASFFGPSGRQSSEKKCEQAKVSDKGELISCVHHLGCNQFSVGFGNFVILFYGLLAFFNSLFLLSSGIMMYLIVKNIDVPIQSIAASLTDNTQPANVDKAASKAPSKVTQKASQTKPSSATMKK